MLGLFSTIHIMKPKHSLKYQFNKHLIIGISALLIIFSILLYHILFIGITTSMHRTMSSMAKHYAAQVQHKSDFQLPRTGRYRAYIGLHAIPKEYLLMFNHRKFNDYKMLMHHGDKSHLFKRPKKIYFLYVQPLLNTDKKLYLIFDDSIKRPPSHKSDFRPTPKFKPILTVPISIFGLMLLGVMFIFWVARKLIIDVLTPLNQLSEMAKNINQLEAEQTFTVMHNKTEIGDVANTLHQSIKRINRYHQREKAFLQNASHELRTPIAVVSSALDIINLRIKHGNQQIEDQLANMQRANKNMAEITDALLHLSRKACSKNTSKWLIIDVLLAQVIEEHSYLLKNKNVNVKSTFSTQQQQVKLNESLCRIVLSNLVRNAFEHSWQGTITVSMTKVCVSITNECSDLSKTKEEVIKGFGLGLEIVQQIASQQGWQCHFKRTDDGLFVAKICFDS